MNQFFEIGIAIAVAITAAVGVKPSGDGDIIGNAIPVGVQGGRSLGEGVEGRFDARFGEAAGGLAVILNGGIGEKTNDQVAEPGGLVARADAEGDDVRRVGGGELNLDRVRIEARRW